MVQLVAATALLAALLAAALPTARSTEIPAETIVAFERYVDAAAKATGSELHDPYVFLNLRTLEAPDQARAMRDVRAGRTSLRRLRLRDAAGKELEVPDAWVHHWIGTAFMSAASLDSAVDVAQDYDAYARIFAPDVVRSRILARGSDSDMQVQLRLRQKKIITVTYDTQHEVRYQRLSPTRVFSIARAARIREIADAGKPDEREKAEGDGYLWRIHTTWRYEEVEDGLLIENESLMLTRRVPFLLRPIVGPMVRNGPRDGVLKAIDAVRRELDRRRR